MSKLRKILAAEGLVKEASRGRGVEFDERAFRRDLERLLEKHMKYGSPDTASRIRSVQVDVPAAITNFIEQVALADDIARQNEEESLIDVSDWNDTLRGLR